MLFFGSTIGPQFFRLTHSSSTYHSSPFYSLFSFIAHTEWPTTFLQTSRSLTTAKPFNVDDPNAQSSFTQQIRTFTTSTAAILQFQVALSALDAMSIIVSRRLHSIDHQLVSGANCHYVTGLRATASFLLGLPISTPSSSNNHEQYVQQQIVKAQRTGTPTSLEMKVINHY